MESGRPGFRLIQGFPLRQYIGSAHITGRYARFFVQLSDDAQPVDTLLLHQVGSPTTVAKFEHKLYSSSYHIPTEPRDTELMFSYFRGFSKAMNSICYSKGTGGPNCLTR